MNTLTLWLFFFRPLDLIRRPLSCTRLSFIGKKCLLFALERRFTGESNAQKSTFFTLRTNKASRRKTEKLTWKIITKIKYICVHPRFKYAYTSQNVVRSIIFISLWYVQTRWCLKRQTSEFKKKSVDPIMNFDSHQTIFRLHFLFLIDITFVQDVLSDLKRLLA